MKKSSSRSQTATDRSHTATGATRRSGLWQWGLTLLLGVAVWAFWAKLYPSALAYQEQFQLFLTTPTYLLSRLSLPGGAASYVAEFMVSFYNNMPVGAIFVALLLMLLQRLTWRLMKQRTDAEGYYVLSFVPSVAVWLLMGDESVMLAYVVSLLLAMSAMWGYSVVAHRCGEIVRYIYVLIVLPLLYWLVGPVVFMFAVWVLLHECELRPTFIGGIWIGLLAVLLAWCLVLASSFFVAYPLKRLSQGLFYYRFVDFISPWIYVLMALCVLLPFAVRWMPSLNGKTMRWALAGQVVLLALMFVGLKPRAYEPRKYELMEYDFLVRQNRWDDIIRKAEQKTPDLPMSVCATNLALGMKGQLCERAFDFFQRGTDGLLPKFERNFTSCQVTGEAFFMLGLVNTAQRFSFESMEALPNYNKSCRTVRRLVETNLINGQYNVAQKYIDMLKNTLFYAKWAKRTEKLLGNEKAINSHPLYGRMRQIRLTDDFLFSDQEIDKIMGQLLLRNQDNQLAMQYLLMCPLLSGDLNTFMNYLSFVQKNHSFNPQICQEAVCMVYAQHNQQPPQAAVSPLVMQRFSNFYSILRSQGKDAPQLQAFRNTLWYYLLKD